MPRVLTFCDYYLPGYRAGGPIRSIANMAYHLGHEFDFMIVTRDRDYGDAMPYSGIRANEWQTVGKAKVMFLSPERWSLKTLRAILSQTDHDVLYLNSVFSPRFTIGPLLLRRIGLGSTAPVIVAPRGEFSPRVMALKALRKTTFLSVAKVSGLYKDVLWQASSEFEARDIRQILGDDANVIVAPNMSRGEPLGMHHKRPAPNIVLRVLFLSRITPKKNLGFALDVLRSSPMRIMFNIFGPLEDLSYWHQCQQIMNDMPPNITVQYYDSIPHEKVHEVMQQHHILFLPTLGENYGHVIHEALLSGCLVLTSDQTPWRGLECLRIGWDLPLDEPHRFLKALNQCGYMDFDTFNTCSEAAVQYALQLSQDDRIICRNITLLRAALNGTVLARSAESTSPYQEGRDEK